MARRKKSREKVPYETYSMKGMPGKSAEGSWIILLLLYWLMPPYDLTSTKRRKTYIRGLFSGICCRGVFATYHIIFLHFFLVLQTETVRSDQLACQLVAYQQPERSIHWITHELSTFFSLPNNKTKRTVLKRCKIEMMKYTTYHPIFHIRVESYANPMLRYLFLWC